MIIPDTAEVAQTYSGVIAVEQEPVPPSSSWLVLVGLAAVLGAVVIASDRAKI